MTDVFLSYAHEDRSIVAELVKLLRSQNMDVWWDRAISVGRDLNSIIDAKLAESRAVVVVWSRSSVRSMWVRGEAADALEAGKLVPIAIEPVRYPIPFTMCETAELHGWPDIAAEEALHRFLQALNAMIGRDRTGLGRLPVKSADDPTLSVRVARRVADALIQNTSANPRIDLSQLDSILAETAILLLEGSAWKPVPDGLLSAILDCIPDSRLALWDASTFLWGDPNLLPQDDTNEEQAPTIQSNDGKWLFCVTDRSITLTVEWDSSNNPSARLVDRLHSSHRVLVHWISGGREP